MKKFFMSIAAMFTVLTLAACSDASVASANLSRDADNFKILRNIKFYNGITNEVMLEIEGFCALGNNDTPQQRTVTCKDGPSSYKKHFLGLSDNVTYFAEQIEGANVSTSHYKVVFKPSVIIPHIEVR